MPASGAPRERAGRRVPTAPSAAPTPTFYRVINSNSLLLSLQTRGAGVPQTEPSCLAQRWTQSGRDGEVPTGTDCGHRSAVDGPLTCRVRGGVGPEFPPSFFPSQITRQKGKLALGLRRPAQCWASRARAGWGAGDFSSSETPQGLGLRSSRS